MKKTLVGIAVFMALGSYCLFAKWSLGESSFVTGTVQEVRVLGAFEPSLKGGGDAVGKAVLGAFLAGPAGAVVGSASGDSSSAFIVKPELLACRLFVEMPDGAVAVFSIHPDIFALNLCEQCALLRKGDKLVITRTTYPEGRVVYFWTNDQESWPGETLPSRVD